MGENLGTAVLELRADISGLKRDLNEAQRRSSRFTSSVKGLFKGGIFAGAGFEVANRGVDLLFGTLQSGFDELKQSKLVMAQTNAVLKSTGGVSKVSAKHVSDLAGSLLKLSGIDDEAIQSGENLLLTFKNIQNQAGKGNDIFDQTTKIMVDMSVAMGQDMKSSAIQLGKALNDPVKGLTALQRVGVQFDARQKQTIKDLVEGRKAVDNFAQSYTGNLTPAQSEQIVKMSKAHAGWREIADTLNLKVSPAIAKQMDYWERGGHQMEAQKMILKELNSEFAGSAKAAGDTLPGQINKLRESFKNLTAQGIELAFEKFEELKPTIETFIAIIKGLAPVLEPLARYFFDALVTPMKVIADLLNGDFSKAWKDIKQPIIDVRDVLAGMWTIIKKPFENMVNGVKGGFTGINDWARDKIGAIAGFFTSIPGKIGDFGGELLNKIKDQFAQIPGWILDAIKGYAHLWVWYVREIADFGKDLLDKIAGFVNAAGIADFLSGKVQAFADLFFHLPGKIAGALERGVKGALGRIKSWFSDLFGWLPGWAKDILEIHSPSKVFEEIGEHVVEGLIQGLGNMAGKLKDYIEKTIMRPIDWVKKEIGAISDLFTGGTIGVATGKIQLPTTFSPTHETSGLPGYPAIDVMAPGGTLALSPNAGKIHRTSGRPFSEGWSNGPGSAIGLSMYLASSISGRAVDYFLTHFDRMYVGEGATVAKGTPLGTVGPMDDYGVAAHIHEGLHWYRKGGIFKKPSIIGIGEAGPEAVVPLNKAGGLGGETHIHFHGPVIGTGLNQAAQELLEPMHRALLRKQARGTLGFQAS